jgi:hypothetical protein
VTARRRARLLGSTLAIGLLLAACSPYEWRHELQWDSSDQVWLSEESQVKLRAAQSRVFETSDRRALLEAVVATMQDIGFRIDVLDEALGVVSGRRFEAIERPETFYDPTYHLYDDQSLIVFTRAYRSWGPFWNRSDLVRLTVTIRPRGERQMVVRASAQFTLRAVEDPEAYQAFFRALEQASFLQAQGIS